MKIKYIKGDFFIVPNRMALRTLRPRAQLVFIWLCAKSSAEGICFPSIKKIREEGHQSYSTISRAIRDLVTAGFIEKTNQNGKQNQYQIMIIDPRQDRSTYYSDRGDLGHHDRGGRSPLPRGSVTMTEGVGQPVPEYGSTTDQDRSNNTQYNTHKQYVSNNIVEPAEKKANTETESEKKIDPVNQVLSLVFFHHVFPADFAESNKAYAKPMIRTLVQATLTQFTYTEIKRLLESYEARMAEEFAPQPGKSVYMFFKDNRLTAIKNFVDKRPSENRPGQIPGYHEAYNKEKPLSQRDRDTINSVLKSMGKPELPHDYRR